ncbi:MAG: chorismate mutase [Candidatus Bathyarchaeota archaeon]|nr:chorismate mutase [Candidatus Bathyarchaeota archaeon]
MEQINQLREKIDDVDEQVLVLLRQRVEICRTIGILKKKSNMAIQDSSRENYVYETVKQKAADLGLDSKKIDAIYHQIVNMCSSVQN